MNGTNSKNMMFIALLVVILLFTFVYVISGGIRDSIYTDVSGVLVDEE